MLESLPISDWLHQAGEIAVSRELLEILVLQFGLVATTAWIIAALDITGLLTPTASALDSAALTIGAVRLSLLLVAKAVLLIAILMWAALALSRLIGSQMQRLALSPSVQALTRNL